MRLRPVLMRGGRCSLAGRALSRPGQREGGHDEAWPSRIVKSPFVSDPLLRPPSLALMQASCYGSEEINYRE